jgi:hypothetical protein
LHACSSNARPANAAALCLISQTVRHAPRRTLFVATACSHAKAFRLAGTYPCGVVVGVGVGVSGELPDPMGTPLPVAEVGVGVKAPNGGSVAAVSDSSFESALSTPVAL